ncbi:unnamed protein product [Ranitomeya imitator]|uniref:V-SNARE coiled-coil homology domain-containing protein n=1 Tax=Ranitomeya imitator TaxID=111125 RepID=A0ABN9LG18_9NEOB|nr:unnamed protein product [Ranitomeya imitator]
MFLQEVDDLIETIADKSSKLLAQRHEELRECESLGDEILQCSKQFQKISKKNTRKYKFKNISHDWHIGSLQKRNDAMLICRLHLTFIHFHKAEQRDMQPRDSNMFFEHTEQTQLAPEHAQMTPYPSMFTKE